MLTLPTGGQSKHSSQYPGIALVHPALPGARVQLSSGDLAYDDRLSFAKVPRVLTSRCIDGHLSDKSSIRKHYEQLLYE